MVAQTQRGFTIIEVMLFLAISGLLFAMLMIGVNNGIAQQRYLDSVRSYKAFLQDQYSETLNTRNSRSNSLDCTATGVVDNGADSTPGTNANCVILGRVIKITPDGQKVTVDNVIGHTTADRSDDLETYNPQAMGQEETWDMDWGSQLKLDDTQGFGTNTQPMILIIRSPASGLVRVFVASSNVDLKDMVSSDNAATYTTSKLCHYIDGESGSLPKQWVAVDPKIASADGVSTSETKTAGCL